MAMRVSVDRSRCLGSGNCLTWASEVFDQSDDDFLVVVLDEAPPAERWEAVEQAARFCPGQAIRVEREV
jgi:ferredoxin